MAAWSWTSVCPLSLGLAGAHPRSTRGKKCGKAASVRGQACAGLGSTAACKAELGRRSVPNETGRAKTPVILTARTAFCSCVSVAGAGGPAPARLGAGSASLFRLSPYGILPCAVRSLARRASNCSSDSAFSPSASSPVTTPCGEFAAPLGSGHSICTGR